jgi:hypothetical protein
MRASEGNGGGESETSWRQKSKTGVDVFKCKHNIERKRGVVSSEYGGVCGRHEDKSCGNGRRVTV